MIVSYQVTQVIVSALVVILIISALNYYLRIMSWFCSCPLLVL